MTQLLEEFTFLADCQVASRPFRICLESRGPALTCVFGPEICTFEMSWDSTLKLVRSICFYIVLLYSTILFGLTAIIAAHMAPNGNWAHLVARLWARINLLASGVRIHITGLDRLTPNQPYIFLSNHQSWFDIFAILGKLPVQFRWLAKEELFKLPVLGRAMLAAGYIPINRNDSKKAKVSIDEAAQRVQRGASVVIFPEGTRSRNGVLQDFKKGGIILAIKSKQPIVPIAISGSHRVLPRHGGWVLNPGTIYLTIDQPIETTGFSLRDRDSLLLKVRERIRSHLTQAEGGLLHEHTVSKR